MIPKRSLQPLQPYRHCQMDSFTGMSLIRDNIPCNKQDTVLNTGDIRYFGLESQRTDDLQVGTDIFQG